MALKNRKNNYPLYETTHFKDFREMCVNVTARYPDRIAFSYKKSPLDKEVSHYTYAEGQKIIVALATEQLARGMCRQNVAIIGEISPEWAYTYFSLMSMGAVTVPIDRELPPDDMRSILATAECPVVFYSGTVAKKIAEIRESLPCLKTFIQLSGELIEGAEAYESFRAAGQAKVDAGDKSYETYPLDPDALASIVFTSGTTGKGKGVMLTSRNICADMEQGMYNFQITPKTMMALPPHHTFGSTVNLVGHYAQGVEIYLSSGLKYITAELKAFKPTHLILVPLFVETFYKKIMATAEKTGQLEKLQKGIKLSNTLRKIGIDLRKKLFGSVLENFGGELEMIICGGAALNQKVIDFFEDIGVTILNGYGITECAPLISCNRNECRKNGSVGMPIIGGEAKILYPDENGEGEICYRGPNVMLGYYKNEEATKEAFADGWFRTGDLGKIVTYGKDQWIYITGRSKNLIILSNGKNVYPEEIETDIQGIYGVGEVVVYEGQSKSDPEHKMIVAEIFPDAEAMKLHNITDAQSYFETEIRAVNAKNVSYKHIEKVKIRDVEFEKNTSRKIVRFKIDKTVD